MEIKYSSPRIIKESSEDKKVPRTIKYRPLSVKELLDFPGWGTWTEEEFFKWYDKPYAVSIAGMKEFPVHSYSKDYSPKKIVMWDPESVPQEVFDFFSVAGGPAAKILSKERSNVGWDSSYKTFENRIYASIDEYNSRGGEPVPEDAESEDPLKFTAPWNHEKATALLKKIAPTYGVKVYDDPETSFWAGITAEGKEIRKSVGRWRDFTVDLRRRLDVKEENGWTHEYKEGRASRDITTALTYYYSPDWSFALIVKEKIYAVDRKIWCSLWFEKL